MGGDENPAPFFGAGCGLTTLLAKMFENIFSGNHESAAARRFGEDI
jgi:hypothetical protein